MSYPFILIELPGIRNFSMYFDQDGMNVNSAPSWAQLKHTLCPSKCLPQYYQRMLPNGCRDRIIGRPLL